MGQYRHQRGKITDNALQALLHDPLFKQRVEKNRKGKGSYQRKAKNGKGDWEANGKRAKAAFTIGPLISGLSVTDGYFAL